VYLFENVKINRNNGFRQMRQVSATKMVTEGEKLRSPNNILNAIALFSKGPLTK
jgi:hypothetical protein